MLCAELAPVSGPTVLSIGMVGDLRQDPLIRIGGTKVRDWHPDFILAAAWHPDAPTV